MSENPIRQILSDLLPYFEALEAQSSAILQLLRDKRIANDEEVSRYLEQAGDASSVKWRAARVRMEHLFAVSPEPPTAPKTETAEKEKKEAKETNGRTDAKQDPAQATRPDAVATAEESNRPSSSDEVRRVPEKSSNETPKDAPTKIVAPAKADSADVYEAESSKKAEKDAA